MTSNVWPIVLCCTLLSANSGLVISGERAERPVSVVQANRSSHLEALDVVQVLGCPAAVHKLAASKASFILEPLLCWRAGMERLVCPGFDYMRSRHFLRVPVLLTDPAVPVRAKTLLQKHFPVTVEFMDLEDVSLQLKLTDNRVEVELEEKPYIERGLKYLLVRVYCTSTEHCQDIRLGIASQPSLFFEKLRFSLSSGATATDLKRADRVVAAGPLGCQKVGTRQPPTATPAEAGNKEAKNKPSAAEPAFENQTTVIEMDGQLYLLVQQRSNGGISFNRSWVDYENGFGVLNGDYWIGLRLLHALTKPNRVLRVEMVRFRGSTFHQDFFSAEYNDFKVGPAPLYALSYSAFNKPRSSAFGDALAESRGRGFSTVDRDNDIWPHSCSQLRGGGGGWWFGSCGASNPNGLFPGVRAGNESSMRWAYLEAASGSRMETLKYIRLLLRL